MSTNFIQNKKILITGGAGFIGSNLAEKLLQQKNRVIVLDNFSTGKRENIAPFLSNPDFQLITGDIRDRECCQKAVENVDFVLHEAALGSVPRSIKDPMTTTEVNILGFVNMLFASSQAGVKRFVYAASSSVYGDSPLLPKVESQIGNPLSPYAVTKYANELYGRIFHDLYKIDVIGLRYFNVFGRRQDPAGAYAAVIPRFVESLLHHNSPVIYGDGTNSRDFTYIDNVLQANLLALGTENPAAINQIYNVAVGESITLNDLFAAIRQELAAFDPAIAGIPVEYAPARSGDIPHSLADISKAVSLLGYAPKYHVKDGLIEAAKWYFDYFASKN